MNNYIPISDVVWFQEGPGVRNTQYTNDGVKLLNVANLVNGEVDISNTNRYISEEEAYGKYKHFLADEGDLIIASSGIKVDYFDKKMGFVKKEHLPLCMNTSTIRFKSLDSDIFSIKYFMHFLKSESFKQQLATQITGSAQLNFGPSHLKKMYVKVVSIEEQHLIANKLDKVNSLILARKQQLEKLDQLVKSRFVEMFGEVENLIHRWDVKRFADVTINLDSTRKPVKDADRQKMQGEYPYYGATGIVDYVNDYRIDGTFLLISEDGKALEFRNKDIAFIASGKIWVNNHAHILQCTEDIQMIFLKCYMNFRNISDWVTGIDQKKLNRANLDKIPIGLPPIGLQKEFSAFVEQVDKSKATVQQSLEKLETLKKALMQEYFG